MKTLTAFVSCLLAPGCTSTPISSAVYKDRSHSYHVKAEKRVEQSDAAKRYINRHWKTEELHFGSSQNAAFKPFPIASVFTTITYDLEDFSQEGEFEVSLRYCDVVFVSLDGRAHEGYIIIEPRVGPATPIDVGRIKGELMETLPEAKRDEDAKIYARVLEKISGNREAARALFQQLTDGEIEDTLWEDERKSVEFYRFTEHVRLIWDVVRIPV